MIYRFYGGSMNGQEKLMAQQPLFTTIRIQVPDKMLGLTIIPQWYDPSMMTYKIEEYRVTGPDECVLVGPDYGLPLPMGSPGWN